MNKTTRLMIFALLAALILASPAAIILKHERILREGHAFKFRVRPRDPYDAFRGRYVQLAFAGLEAKLPPGLEWRYHQDFQVAMEEGPDGFAVVKGISVQPPEGTPDYVTMETEWHSDYSNRMVRLEPPFSQFFMNERLAPGAERAVWSRGATNIWAEVRILNGRGVIENLMFDGVPAADFVRGRHPM